GHQSQAADQARAQVTNHVAEQVFHDQNVKMGRLQGQLHAQGIDVQLLEFEEGVIISHFAGGTEKKAIALGENIRLVTEGDLPPPLVPRQLKRVTNDALRSGARDEQ